MSANPTVDPALQDALTGLANRRALVAALRARVPGGQGAFVILDLDGFRKRCEGYPRDTLNGLLLEVSQRLRAAAGPDALLYRYAGDAFCLLLPGADRDQAAASAEALRETVAREPLQARIKGRSEPIPTPVTASAAAAAYPLDGRTPTQLIETAELALFVAKHTGRNRVAVAGRLDAAALAEIGVFRGLPCPILVGRVAEQSKLRQIAADVRHVGPALALVTGPPGIGKTRLLRELGLWARAERFVVLGATCQEPRASLPYAVLSEQIENLLATDRALAAEAFGRLDAAHRTALSVVIRDLPPDAGPAAPLEDYRRAVFDGFLALLAELSKVGPLYAVADEAEYADAASGAIFKAARERRLPLLLAVSTDRERTEFGRTPVGDYLRACGPAVTAVGLPPLPPEETRQMLHAILPDAVLAPEVIERLVSTCGGNPLHLEEMLRSLLLRGKARLHEGRWVISSLGPEDVPRDLDSAIRAVSQALPSRANSLLTRAAVIGSHIDPELLQEVMGQDEAEMMDLIDEARRSRLLITSDTEADLLAFPAAHARRVRLAASDAQERQEIHGRVGVVQESRHGGDVAHLADELAFHYGRAGNETRARHFDALARRRAELVKPPDAQGVRRARLETFKDPLGAAALEHALGMMRHFAGVLKVGRLYPEWSQVASSFLAQLRAELEALLSSCRGVTIAATPQGPSLNGKECDAAVAADFAALMDERLIESITMASSFKPARLETIVRAFMEPFDRVRAEPDLWDRFLTREGIEALDIVQKEYQAREREGALAKKEESVPAEHLPAVRDVLRYAKAAIDNRKLYPSGHSLVRETQAEASRALLDALESVPALTLGTAEGELVLNGRPADRKFFGDGGQFFVKEIDRRKLKSITIRKGLSEEEVRALVGYFAISPGDTEAAAQAATLGSQLTHVEFGSREYERATEGVQEVELSPPPKPIRSELRAREHLARPYDQFLSPEFDEQFPVLVEALAYGTHRPVAEELVDRLGGHFHDKELDHRTQAYNLLSRSLAFASPTTRQLEVLRSHPPLKRRLVEDQAPEEFRAAADVLPFWIPAAATTGCLRELAEVAGQVLRRRADAKETPPEVAATCECVLQQIPETGSFQVIVAAVQKPKQHERVPAVSILLSVGGLALERLVGLFADEEDVNVRRSLAMMMTPCAPAVAAELARLLDGREGAPRIQRVLPVVEPFLVPPLTNVLGDLVERGTPEVRQALLEAAERWPRSASLPIVRKLLASPQAANRDLALAMATRMKLAQLGSDIGRILEHALDEKLIALCSEYFAAVPNPVVVPLLVRVVEKRPRWFGFVKGYSARTRAAAVRALRLQGTKQAEEAAREAAEDPEVRELVSSDAAPGPSK